MKDWLITLFRYATGPEDTFVTNQLVRAEAESLIETQVVPVGVEDKV